MPKNHPYLPAANQDITPESPSAPVRLWFVRSCRVRYGLAPRLCRMLLLIACGYTRDKQLAAMMCVEPRTIKGYSTDLYARLGTGGVGEIGRPPAAAIGWRLLRQAERLAWREESERARAEDGDAVVAGVDDGGGAGAGAAHLGNVGADGALWAAGVSQTDGRMGAGSEDA